MQDKTCIIVAVMLLLLLSAGTMETGRLRATGSIVVKSLLVPMSCSGTNGHTQVCSRLIHCIVLRVVKLSLMLSHTTV